MKEANRRSDAADALETLEAYWGQPLEERTKAQGAAIRYLLEDAIRCIAQEEIVVRVAAPYLLGLRSYGWARQFILLGALAGFIALGILIF